MINKQKIDGILKNMYHWKPDWNILEFLPPRPSTSKSSLPWNSLRVSFHIKSTHLLYVFLPFMWSNTFETCSLSSIAYFCLNNLLVASWTLEYLSVFDCFCRRWGLDRKGRLAIESYIRGNNLALDVSSVLDGFGSPLESFLASSYYWSWYSWFWLVIDRSGYRLDSPVQDLASSLA